MLGGGPARAQTGPYTGITDSDSGSHADNAGHGRGPGGNRYGQPAQPQHGQTGYSDSDSGANADPSGGGGASLVRLAELADTPARQVRGDP